MLIPLSSVGNMEQEQIEQVTVKVDSKGRICIPAEIREEIGNTATLKKTPQKATYYFPANAKISVEELRKIINSKHHRTGKPENWSPEKMKSIWSKTQ